MKRENPFTITAADGPARCGSFATAHGVFETPNFMPVGTQGTVKGVDAERLSEAGAQIVLVNTYHLLLRPGPEQISKLGGIHRFSAWNGSILSDSGGFQVFSLQDIRKVREEGVEFRSHIDGARHFLSPERAVEVQEQLGVDIAMALDECPAADLDSAAMEASLSMTIRWAARCLAARTRTDMSLFGITQGGADRALRQRAAVELCELPFDGFAIGGLSVGEPKEVMYEVLSYHPQELPYERIRYLMGVGTPQDIVEAVHAGVDLFDCVLPTRSGRFGRAYVSGEEPYLNIRNACHRDADIPLDEECSCLSCRHYSRAYLHHLFRCGEMLGPQLLSVHNLTYYLSLMKNIRIAIREGRFQEFYNQEGQRWRCHTKLTGLCKSC